MRTEKKMEMKVWKTLEGGGDQRTTQMHSRNQVIMGTQHPRWGCMLWWETVISSYSMKKVQWSEEYDEFTVLFPERPGKWDFTAREAVTQTEIL